MTRPRRRRLRPADHAVLTIVIGAYILTIAHITGGCTP